MSVASITTANVRPSPNSWMKLIFEAAKAMNTTASVAGRRGDDAAGALEADGHRVLVVAGEVVLLLDAREQEDLVVHRQAEGDAEHQDRTGEHELAGRGEVEQARQMALLEDPHHRPVGRARGSAG